MATQPTTLHDALPQGALAKYAAVSISAASGDQEIVAAVASKQIVVISYMLSSSVDNGLTWKSATAGNITGKLEVLALSPGGAGYSPAGHFATTAGEALELTVETSADVGGHITYVEV